VILPATNETYAVTGQEQATDSNITGQQQATTVNKLKHW